jgi:hypothetical protein
MSADGAESWAGAEPLSIPNAKIKIERKTGFNFASQAREIDSHDGWAPADQAWC